MHLSVIIPAYNEVDRIGRTLQAVADYLKHEKYEFEIIVIDDGSTDGTEAYVRHMAENIHTISLTRLPKNQGKGAAVKAGMLAATGTIRLFMDADGSTNIHELKKLLPYLDKGFDIAVGSRLVTGAVKQQKQHLSREFLGWIFRRLVGFIVPIDIEDPQNGFKLFTKSAAEIIFTGLTTNGWSFDVETLVLARKFRLKVKEVPIVWVNDARSKLRFSHMIRMLIDLVRIRQRYG